MENNEDKKYPIGGFAPGSYTCICVTCKNEFTGDKRAVQCEDCATKDNRQMTALQEHLRYLKGIRSGFDGYPGAESVVATLDRSIQNAESLLPKEREMIMSSFVAGDERGTGDIPFNCEQYFSQTYTQDYKTK